MFSGLKAYLSAQAAARKERGGVKYIILQSAIILVCLGLILMFYEFLGGIIVASLGASSFILFATPNTNSSKTANLVGGYIIGSLSGVAFSFLHIALNMFDYPGMHIALIIGCAAAAAVATFFMVLTGLVHPPVAALAIALAADQRSLLTAGAAIIGIVILCTVRNLLRGRLKNLI